ncbi:MAG: PEP-CTERM sorting domain-containing protein [Gammaproteobacteria bacterium]|nr:PEP-CTERM sorting domain-containing protein [Gammaproteobacteria bacterium]MCP5136236.1 PEP-CTERM sorting domain-containing protein [Gammaproteobacteria bacterium]
MFVRNVVTGLALSFALSSAHGAIINGDFADVVSLNGWSSIGNVSEQPDGVTDDRAILSTASGSTNKTLINSELGINIDALTASYTGSGTAGNASVLYQSFNIIGTGTISFDWNFLTSETGNFGSNNDFAFYVLQSAIGLADVGDTVPGVISGFSRETGFSTEVISGLSAGTYLIGFGVVNKNNTSTNSGLLIDNVILADTGATTSTPLPATVALLGLGLIGVRRRVR